MALIARGTTGGGQSTDDMLASQTSGAGRTSAPPPGPVGPGGPIAVHPNPWFASRGIPPGGGLPATATLMRALNSAAARAQGDKDLPIFVGGKAFERSEDDFKRNVPNEQRVQTMAELMTEFTSASLDEKREMGERLWLAGLLGEDLTKVSLADVEKTYQDILGLAADRFMSGEQVTPDSLIDDMIEYRYGDKDMTAAEALQAMLQGEDKSGTFTSTQEVIDLTSASEAKALMRQALQSALGRDPEEEEFEDFISLLHTQEEENPLQQTTTQTMDAEGRITDTKTTSEGGIDAGQFALEQAQSRPNYAEYQAVATYMPLIEQALGAMPGATA